MARERRRRSGAKGRRRKRPPSPAPNSTGADAAVKAALEEIQRVLDTPLADLMDTEEERAEAEELTRQALAVPAMVRLRELVAFVGKGRLATQAGNLKPQDAAALATLLGTRDDLSGEGRSMND